MKRLMLNKDTPFIELLKDHPEAVKKVLEDLNLSCLDCKGIGRETVAQIAIANGLDVDEFIGVIRSLIKNSGQN
ncbi:MAG: DUF1858 domain-containing protein [Thermodesulfobacteriota bacterium]